MTRAPLFAAALLLAQGTAWAQGDETDLPPLSPLLLCRLGQDRSWAGIYPLIQDYPIHHRGSDQPIEQLQPISINSWEIPLPGVLVSFNDWQQVMVLHIEDLEQARPYIDGLMDLAKVGASVEEDQLTWGKPSRKIMRWDPDANDHVNVQRKRDVRFTLPPYNASGWARYGEDGTTLELLIFGARSWDQPPEACRDADYPDARPDQSRWEPVKQAFEDPTALPMLFSIEELGIRDWWELVHDHGFTVDLEDEMVRGHGLEFALDLPIRELAVDVVDGWSERAGLSTFWPDGCSKRWRGEISIETSYGGDGRPYGTAGWYLIRNPGAPLDPSRPLADYVTLPHCVSGDCENGRGEYYWSELCSYRGSFVVGERINGLMLYPDDRSEIVGHGPQDYWDDKEHTYELEGSTSYDEPEPEPYDYTVPIIRDESSSSDDTWRTCSFTLTAWYGIPVVTASVLVTETNGWTTWSGSTSEHGGGEGRVLYLSYRSGPPGTIPEGEWRMGTSSGHASLSGCSGG